MSLRHLQVDGFRNLQQIAWDPHPRLNVIWGDNGQGKTSLLEAIYFLANLKSFRTSRNRDLIQRHQTQARVEALVEKDQSCHKLQFRLSETQRDKRIDGKTVQSNEQIYQLLQPVLFSPDDVALPKGGPAGRRDLLDRAIFTERPAYLNLALAYAKVLKNRNALLKSRQFDLLADWDEGLVEYGVRIRQERTRFIESMQTEFCGAYDEIAQGREKASLTAGIETDLERLRQQLNDQLVQTASREREMGTTLCGPHRDDIEFLLDENSARRYASQGQMRSLILAFKIAQARMLHQSNGHPPMLLLDDMTSELDRTREDYLIQFLAEAGGQVFVTTTNVELFCGIDPQHLQTQKIDRGRLDS